MGNFPIQFPNGNCQTFPVIGYPKANEFEADTLEWLFDCEAVVPFLEWLCENIHETNVLSAEDLKR